MNGGKLDPERQPLGEIFDYSRDKILAHVVTLNDYAALQHWITMSRDAIRALEHGYSVWEDGEPAVSAASFYSKLYRTAKARLMTAGDTNDSDHQGH